MTRDRRFASLRGQARKWLDDEDSEAEGLIVIEEATDDPHDGWRAVAQRGPARIGPSPRLTAPLLAAR